MFYSEIAFREYSIPSIDDILEENLNELQDQMKEIMHVQVCSMSYFMFAICPLDVLV